VIVDLCEKGDKLLGDEVAKVFKGKKITKGIGFPTTISPSSYITPYTPLKSDVEEAKTELKAGEIVKIQLGAQIDGFGTIICDNIVVGGKVTGRDADLLLATHYANELLLRMMLPPGLVAAGTTEEEKKKAASQKPFSQAKMSLLLEKIAKSYDCNIVESTTTWLFDRNEIEGKKKIILSPGDGVKGDGLPEVGEVWGVEMGLSLGSGKVKTLNNRTTLHRRTTTNYGLKRPSSRATLTEVVKKFGTFPFSLRQLEDERAGKVGIVECVRGNVIRQYEVVADKDNEPVSRLFTTIGKSLIFLILLIMFHSFSCLRIFPTFSFVHTFLASAVHAYLISEVLFHCALPKLVAQQSVKDRVQAFEICPNSRIVSTLCPLKLLQIVDTNFQWKPTAQL
jgi:methionine aminopeptidase